MKIMEHFFLHISLNSLLSKLTIARLFGTYLCNLTAASQNSSILNVYQVCFHNAPKPLNFAELFFKMIAN